MYVCICNAVTDGEIREAYDAGAHTFEALQDALGVATCCGCCEPAARDILASCQCGDQACCDRDSVLPDVQYAVAPAG